MSLICQIKRLQISQSLGLSATRRISTSGDHKLWFLWWNEQITHAESMYAAFPWQMQSKIAPLDHRDWKISEIEICCSRCHGNFIKTVGEREISVTPRKKLGSASNSFRDTARVVVRFWCSLDRHQRSERLKSAHSQGQLSNTTTRKTFQGKW